MEFSRQEYRGRFPFPSPGHLPDPGINPSLLNHRQILYCLSHQGSPDTLVILKVLPEDLVGWLADRKPRKVSLGCELSSGAGGQTTGLLSVGQADFPGNQTSEAESEMCSVQGEHSRCCSQV